MAQVYSLTDQIESPALNYSNLPSYYTAIDKYKDDIRSHIKSLGYAEPETGKVIRFPVGDGCAEYMVVSVKTPILVHLEVGDCWNFEYVHLLTGAEIRKAIRRVDSAPAIFC